MAKQVSATVIKGFSYNGKQQLAGEVVELSPRAAKLYAKVGFVEVKGEKAPAPAKRAAPKKAATKTAAKKAASPVETPKAEEGK